MAHLPRAMAPAVFVLLVFGCVVLSFRDQAEAQPSTQWSRAAWTQQLERLTALAGAAAPGATTGAGVVAGGLSGGAGRFATQFSGTMNDAMKKAASDSAVQSAAEARHERAAEIAAQAAVKAANESSVMALQAAARARVAAAVADEAVKSAQAAQIEHQKLGKVFLMMGAVVDASASGLIASAIATETGIPAAQIKVSVSKAAATVVKVELPQNGAHTLAQKVQAGVISSIANVPVVAASTTSSLAADPKGVATSQIMSVLHNLQASVAQLKHKINAKKPAAPLPPVTSSSSKIPNTQPPVASSSSSGSVEFREHILNQIAEVHKAMEMELITEKAGQQIISVLTKALPPTQPAAPIAPTTAAALPAATTASSVSSVAAPQVIATPSKIVIDPAAKQDIQKRLHKLLNNISALKNTFSTQVSGTSK